MVEELLCIKVNEADKKVPRWDTHRGTNIFTKSTTVLYDKL